MQFGSKPPSQVFFIENLILGILDFEGGEMGSGGFGKNFQDE